MRNELANSVARTLAQPYGIIQCDRAHDAEGAPPESLGSYGSVLRFYRYWRTFDRTKLESRPNPTRPPPRRVFYCPKETDMTTTLYLSWRDVPKAKWRWANFSPAEIACRGNGSIKINEDALDCLQALRDLLGKPMIVLSGYRSPEHNRRVAGARASKHMEGTAFDIAMANHDPVAFEAAARKAGFLGFGFYPRSGFMHIDLGPARSWGERFPARATRFVPEVPPAREKLAESQR